MSAFVAWWRVAARSDRVMGVVLLVVIVPVFVWATVTFQRGWVAWVSSGAMVFGLLWLLFAWRQAYRLGRALPARDERPGPGE